MYQLASNVRSGKSPRRSGLTLIELLIAVTLTLVIIAVMVRAFKLTSDEIGVGRAKMDMHNQLRTVSETLRRDLQMATCLPRPRGLNDERTGYFEYVEGPERDRYHVDPDTNSFIGDHDDVLALTVRSDEKPFRGRYNGGFVESNLAEVIWFVVHTGNDDYSGQFRLYRRVLLIRPDLDLTALPPAPADFFEANDISARPEAGVMVANSLDELANRRNRYAHNPAVFPHELQNGYGAQASWLSERVLGIDGGDGVADPDHEGEDQLLNNCVGFDVKVFDPSSPVNVSSGTGYLIDPNDPGVFGTHTGGTDQPILTDGTKTWVANEWAGGIVKNLTDGSQGVIMSNTVNTVTATLAGGSKNDWDTDDVYRIWTGPSTLSGGYVDLGDATSGWFSPNAHHNNYQWSANANTWCSWYAGYESDGIDQDDDGLIDEGANGVDDDGINGIDDNAERETQPPYPHPIRSIQISIRMIEKKTNQVLQKTIKESFVPN